MNAQHRRAFIAEIRFADVTGDPKSLRRYMRRESLHDRSCPNGQP